MSFFDGSSLTVSLNEAKLKQALAKVIGADAPAGMEVDPKSVEVQPRMECRGYGMAEETVFAGLTVTFRLRKTATSYDVK